MATGPYQVANQFAGLAVEAVRGTAAATPIWVPVKNPQITANQKWLDDDASRGSAGMTYDQIAGVRHDEYTCAGYAYADSFPWLLWGVLGAKTTTGAGPYTHVLQLQNDNVGSQPPSLTVTDFDGANAYQMTGAQLDELTLKFGAQSALEYDAKFITNPMTSIATPTGRSIPTAEHVIPGWNVVCSLAGTSSTVFVDGEIKIARTAEAIHTGGTQGPAYTFASAIDVTGRLKFVVLSTDPIFGYSLPQGPGGTFNSRNPIATVLTFTDPATTHSIALQMSAVQFREPKRDRGKKWVEVDATFKASMNATDASSGLAPIKATVINSVTSYTAS